MPSTPERGLKAGAMVYMSARKHLQIVPTMWFGAYGCVSTKGHPSTHQAMFGYKLCWRDSLNILLII